MLVIVYVNCGGKKCFLIRVNPSFMMRSHLSKMKDTPVRISLKIVSCSAPNLGLSLLPFSAPLDGKADEERSGS